MSIRRLSSLLLLATLTMLGLALSVDTTSAHANLVSSEPPANAILENPPTEIRLLFSETPDLKFSQVQLLDHSDQVVQKFDPLTADPANDKLLVLPVQTLLHDVYTVAWKAVSAMDGHVTTGSFSFAVGKEINLQPQASQSTSVNNATPISVAARWLSYLSLAILLGGFAFVPLVLMPVLGNDPRAPTAVTPNVFRFRVLYAGWWLAILSTVFSTAVEAQTVAGLSAFMTLLFGTRYGALILIRAGLLVVVGLLLAFRQLPLKRERIAWWWVQLALCALALFTISLGSHAAGEDQPFLPTVADWLHLLATNIWMGGLIALLVALIGLHRMNASASIARVVGRFSNVAAICIFVIVVTGVYRAIAEIGDLANLIHTAYGFTLLVKLVLFFILMGLGAINLFIVKPRMAQAAGLTNSDQALQPLYRLIMRTVGFEIAFVTLVFLITGILTNLQPAYAAFGTGAVLQRDADDLHVILSITPGQPGLNSFTAFLHNDVGQPVTDAQKVTMTFSFVQRDMGETQVDADNGGNGQYTVQGGYMSVVGTWHIRVTIRRNGKDDTQAAFTVPVNANGADLGGPSITLTFLLGLEIILDGILIDFWSRRFRGWKQWVVVLVGIGVIIFGLNISVTGLYENVNTAANDIVAADASSLDRGNEIYVDNCSTCHGLEGRGDGPAAASLNPPPADLKSHVNAHSMDQLFDWVSNGIPGSAMPAFADRLNERDRWDVINYIRTFANK